MPIGTIEINRSTYNSEKRLPILGVGLRGHLIPSGDVAGPAMDDEPWLKFDFLSVGGRPLVLHYRRGRTLNFNQHHIITFKSDYGQ